MENEITFYYFVTKRERRTAAKIMIALGTLILIITDFEPFSNAVLVRDGNNWVKI